MPQDGAGPGGAFPPGIFGFPLFEAFGLINLERAKHLPPPIGAGVVNPQSTADILKHLPSTERHLSLPQFGNEFSTVYVLVRMKPLYSCSYFSHISRISLIGGQAIASTSGGVPSN